jgi:tetratricopeptide (TPR) repeat protein
LISVAGESHAEVEARLIATNSLAYCRVKQKRFEDATQLYAAALDERRAAGTAHTRDGLQLVSGLADAHMYVGKLDEAESLLREALGARREQFGDDHPDTIISMNSLAWLVSNRGKPAEAEPLFRGVANAAKKVFGSRHPSVAIFLENLAVFLRSNGRVGECEPYYVEALQIRREVHGDRAAETIFTMHDVANVRRDLGKFDEAEALYVELESLLPVAVGLGPDTAADVSGNRGVNFAKQQRWAEAEPLLLRNLELRSPRVPDSEGAVQSALRMLVTLYERMGKPERADEFRKRVLRQGE